MRNIEISKLMLKEDHQFLGGMMRKINGKPMAIRNGYKKQFIAGMDSEPVPQKKNNAGRRMANLWLLHNAN